MIRLFYNYYEDKHINRKKEIDFCLQKNLQNKYVNVIIIENQNKLKYSYFFKKINELAEPNDISIICNSDIYLDDTIQLINNIKQNQVYALSRWNVNEDGKAIFFNRRDSQDTWIVRGKVKENVNGEFTLGMRGCDNRIAYEFNKAGYEVLNPSRSIKTYHVHNSKIRNYKESDFIPEPYLVIETSVLCK